MKVFFGVVDIFIEVFFEDNKLCLWIYNEIWNYSLIIVVVKDELFDEK